MMLCTLALVPLTCAAMLPQKFSAATTRTAPGPAVAVEPQAARSRARPAARRRAMGRAARLIVVPPYHADENESRYRDRPAVGVSLPNGPGSGDLERSRACRAEAGRASSRPCPGAHHPAAGERELRSERRRDRGRAAIPGPPDGTRQHLPGARSARR